MEFTTNISRVSRATEPRGVNKAPSKYSKSIGLEEMIIERTKQANRLLSSELSKAKLTLEALHSENQTKTRTVNLLRDELDEAYKSIQSLKQQLSALTAELHGSLNQSSSKNKKKKKVSEDTESLEASE